MASEGDSNLASRTAESLRDANLHGLAPEAWRALRRSRLLGACLRSCVRASHARSPLRAVCRLLRQSAGYAWVWIGLYRRAPARLERVASSGVDRTLLCAGNWSWVGLDHPYHPAANCAREFWRDARGTLARLPAAAALSCGGELRGVLMAQPLKAASFDEAEHALLVQIAQLLGLFVETRELGDECERARESAARYHGLLECVPDAILLCDRGEVRSANESTARLFGVNGAQQMQGRPLLELWHVEDRERARGLATRERTECARLRVLQADGGARAVDVTAVRAGEMLQLVLREPPQQPGADEQLASLRRLASRVAHDFNNMLSVIVTCSSSALHALDAPEDAAAELHEVLCAASRASALAKMLLSIGRSAQVPAASLDLNEMLRSMQGMLLRVLGEQIALSYGLAPQPLHVRADRGQLEQAVVNLVLNARDAMPEGGRLQIETRALQLQAAGVPSDQAPGAYVRLSVCDSGSGIDDAIRAQIFEPFFTTKAEGKGTGLGLTTVQSIVRQSGGFIELSSSPGAGSTFQIWLPQQS